MSFFNNLVGNSNAGGDYAAKQRALSASYDPTIQAGNTARTKLMDAYSKMTETPDFLENQLSSNWAPSAYAQAQQRVLTQAMNNNAAATGQLGSSYSARQMGTQLQDILSADQNKFIDRGVNTFNNGIYGYQGEQANGLSALGSQNELLSGANKAEMDQANQNADSQRALVGGALSMGANFATGGATGAGGLLAGLGKKYLPKEWIESFQSPAISLGQGAANPAQPYNQNGFVGAGSLRPDTSYWVKG